MYKPVRSSKIQDSRFKIQGSGCKIPLSCVLFISCFYLAFSVCADDVRIIETLPYGLIIQFEMPELKSDVKEIDGKAFQILSFQDCSFTHEVSKPQVPIRSVMLGIPEASEPDVSVLDNNYSLLTGYRLPVVEEMSDPYTKDLASSIQFSTLKTFYPPILARIVPTGYIRQQRVARLELCPIQYNPSTGQLRVYKRLQVRVRMNSSFMSNPSSFREDSVQGVYEDLYRDILLNYEQAKSWRLSTRSRNLAPSSPDPITGTQHSTYKLIIEKNGIYKLDYDYLISAGINPSDIDPRRIELQSGGKQLPIYVEGYQDGKFDRGDYIEFYGVRSGSIYTNSNVYWLSLGSQENPGVKSWMMAVKDGKPKTPGLTSPLAFKTAKHLEMDREYDPLKQVTAEIADHFFWSHLRGHDPIYDHTQPIAIELPYRAPNITSQFMLRVCFQGVTFARGASSHKMNVSLNGNLVDVAEWERQTEYISEATLSQKVLYKNNWLTLECADNNGTNDDTDPKWDVYLNWVEIDYWRDFSAEMDMLEFSTETIPPVTKTTWFTISRFSSTDIEVFQIDGSSAIAKITNPQIQKKDELFTVVFEDNVDQPTRYFVTSTKNLLRPQSIVKDEPSTLHDPANKVDYIMITHKDFLSSTERLANFRRKQGLDVLVVNVEDVYDEFSYGVFDPRAIKRFLRYAYFNWGKMPTYVLLMGDAHWDYKYIYDIYYQKYAKYPRIYVPTYHAWSSPYGETAMDHRFVTVSGDDILPDMFIGRIPAESLEDANNAVDKIIAYESSPVPGLWQSKVMLVADDDKTKSGDEIFEESRIYIANNCIPVGYEVVDVYLRRIKEPYKAKKKIITKINEGVLIAEYTGHGGAYHWAHEDMFNWQDIEKLKNPYYPFVITTTCENGYFDNPRNKCIMELFLLRPYSGAVACLSATRLTYGQGNAVFDKKLYPKVFSESPPILGKIVNVAKIDFINLDISAWVSSAEQYTLFGDPATKLALPELKIECELVKSAVDPSKKVEVKSGSVKRPKLDQPTGKVDWVTDTEFSAQMQVSVVYPNNLDEDLYNDLPVRSESVKVWNGEFKNVSLKVPSGVIPGEGRLRLYAAGASLSAIGGIRFSVSKPVIEFYTSEFVNDESLRIYVAITDDLGESGIKSVKCEWRNTETWTSQITPMILGSAPADAPRIEGFWYVIKDNIPLSKPGTKIEYKIIVLDTEGNEVSTEYESIKVPIGVNLAVSKPVFYIAPDISYAYAQAEGSWTLSAPVENNGSKEINRPVGVYFFEGNPDKNNDDLVDQDARLLGSTAITYDQWEPDDQVKQKTRVSVKLDKPLHPGFHQIFVWINPKVDSPLALPGIERVEDADVSDNTGSKLFQINDFLVGKGDENTQVQSLDGTLSMVIPPGAVSETVMSITRLDLPESDWKQPDLEPAPIPGVSDAEGETSVSLGSAFKIQLASGTTLLDKYAQIDIKFDVTRIRDTAKKLKGLTDKKENQLTATEKEWIEIAMQGEAKKLGIYTWQETGVWKYVPSELIMDKDGKKFVQEPYATLPVAENSSGDQLDALNITVDEVATPIGNWVIFFLDSDRYKIYLRREGSKYYESLSRYGEVGKLYHNIGVGLQLDIKKVDKKFKFGDVFRFDTYRELDGSIKSKSLRDYNDGDGTAWINVITAETGTDCLTGEWAIFFIDSKTFEIHSQTGLPAADEDGSIVTSTIGKEVSVPTIGVSVEIHEGRYPFQFGDKFTFRVLLTGRIRAYINSLNTLALMHSNDATPPIIQLWVNGILPQSGAVIPPRPTISLMLSDVNGIDISSLSFSVSVNDRDFHVVPNEDYVVSERNQLDNIPIFYSPVLNIGKYRYRIGVKDFNGNSAKSDIGDYSEFMFLVEEQPDLNPPVIEVTADGQVLTNGQVFSKSPTFVINISDDHALDKSKILLSLTYEDEPLESKYVVNVSNDLRSATIVYATNFMNGEYAIQVQAVDTSNNFAYLSPPDMTPFRFCVDEEVEVRDVINSPNPFSNTTVFSYFLTQPADKVIVKIYTLRGKLVRTLEQDLPKWQYNEEFWDGRDEDGNKLASGVYLYKFIVAEADKKIERIGKLAILR